MTIVIENIKTGLKKTINIVNFSKEQVNEVLWFYNHRTNGNYRAYEID